MTEHKTFSVDHAQCGVCPKCLSLDVLILDEDWYDDDYLVKTFTCNKCDTEWAVGYSVKPVLVINNEANESYDLEAEHGGEDDE